MSNAKPSWGSLIVVAPLAHLIIAAIYLWGWFAGFGAHSSVLADPRDLFSLSISNVMPVYVSGGLIPALIAYLPYRDTSAQIATMPTGRNLDSFRFFVGGVLFVLVFSTWGLFDLYNRGENSSSMLILLSPLLALVVVSILAIKLKMTILVFRTTAIFTGLVAAALANGMSSGQSARLITFDAASKSYPHCGGHRVLRRFGDTYIAVAQGDQKVVTDLECKVVMVFPAPRPKAERRIYWRPFPYIRYEPVKTA